MRLIARERRGGAGCARAGFTLAEVVVTIAIVAIALTLAFQSLNVSKLTAAHTRNSKLARELALYTLGQIEAGLFWEEIETGRTGVYEDYPDFSWELALGEETFIERDPNEGPFDNWAYREEQRRLADDYDEEEEEEVQPYEEVRVKVTYPAIREFPHEVVLEQWIPWVQVYGEDEEAVDGDETVSEGDEVGPGG